MTLLWAGKPANALLRRGQRTWSGKSAFPRHVQKDSGIGGKHLPLSFPTSSDGAIITKHPDRLWRVSEKEFPATTFPSRGRRDLRPATTPPEIFSSLRSPRWPWNGRKCPAQEGRKEGWHQRAGPLKASLVAARDRDAPWRSSEKDRSHFRAGGNFALQKIKKYHKKNKTEGDLPQALGFLRILPFFVKHF